MPHSGRTRPVRDSRIRPVFSYRTSEPANPQARCRDGATDSRAPSEVERIWPLTMTHRMGTKRTKGTHIVAFCLLCLAISFAAACSKKEASPQKQAATQSATPASSGQPAPSSTPSPETAAANMVLPSPYGIHTDDLDAMMKRRYIRALVIINPIAFFYSHGHPMGVMYEALRELEKYVNDKYKTGNVPGEDHVRSTASGPGRGGAASWCRRFHRLRPDRHARARAAGGIHGSASKRLEAVDRQPGGLRRRVQAGRPGRQGNLCQPTVGELPATAAVERKTQARGQTAHQAQGRGLEPAG